MNNKGFTLIELIATIALLAIIATISFVAITNIIKQGKVDNCKTLVNNIKTATSEYVSDNRYKPVFVNAISSDKITIDGSILTSNNYLNGEIINPFTKEIILPSMISIDVTVNDDYTFKSATITAPEVLVSCNQ